MTRAVSGGADPCAPKGSEGRPRGRRWYLVTGGDQTAPKFGISLVLAPWPPVVVRAGVGASVVPFASWSFFAVRLPTPALAMSASRSFLLVAIVLFLSVFRQKRAYFIIIMITCKWMEFAPQEVIKEKNGVIITDKRIV